MEKIEETLGASMESRRISKLEDHKLRNNALNLLHKIQIKNLLKWRKLKKTNPMESEAYLLQLLLLVNALAGGLKGTG
ncbi:hypothetical protein [Litoribacter ruber]|uniref:hypothetical protein n=1 Tax=Litoribacter ruber TaxID=702568 RepID=UPI001FEB734F|nr:hypothetical protein [Litoribacter alkaliphilus]